ncbi:MAG: hypothetical protein U9M92_02320 [Patescibacteria group bacterium]|nr:hypothetical protein [Patescibacteria group bacterium]
MKRLYPSLLIALIALPAVALATDRTIAQIIKETLIRDLAPPVVVLILTLALVYFFAGVAKYIGKAGESKDREEGKKMMVYGIIGLAVMIAVWGLVALLVNTFFPGGPPDAIPTLTL